MTRTTPPTPPTLHRTADPGPVPGAGHALRLIAARYGHALRTPRGIAAVTILAVLVATSVAAPLLFPGGYDQQGSGALAMPTLQAPFGTDEVGRSIFVRAIYGTRTDLTLVAVAVPVAAVVGTLLGLLGLVSRPLGLLAQRLLDLVMGFPSLILGICVVLVIGSGWLSLVISMTIYSTPAFGRLARATLMAQENRDYVLAARMLGTTRPRIMVRHILPHTLDTVITQTVVAAVSAVFLESGLSIVGLGVQPPQPSLGVLLNGGARYLQEQPVYVLGPALLLFALVLGFSLFADALIEKEKRS